MNRRMIAICFMSAAIMWANYCIAFPPVAENLEARNTTVMTITHKPDVVCGALGCSGNNPGHIKGTGHGGAGGGGTTHLGG